MLKKIITALFIMTTTALADYNLIVPQKPSGGTSVWAQIVVGRMGETSRRKDQLDLQARCKGSIGT